MTEGLLDFIQKDTGANPGFGVIWLHGLGADGHDFEPLVPELDIPRETPIRFIFPHAPMQPVTVNGGMVMRAWYDITGLDISADTDTIGINRSAAHLRRLIQATVDSGIPSGRIVLAGFSQGGAIALHTGLQHEDELCGILALSTYAPIPDAIPGPADQGPPILMAHGRFDPVVPYALGLRSRDLLVARGHSVTWHEYPMAHAVHPQEIRDIAAWLADICR